MPGQILVLVAEDEELVRLVIVEALEDAGFEVIEAGHADAALGVLQIHSARIHVLFTDIQMPGAMDGLALAHHTAKNWPKIALLITSARPRPDRASLPRKSRFLAKPYRPTTSFAIFASSRRPHEVRLGASECSSLRGRDHHCPGVVEVSGPERISPTRVPNAAS